MSDAARALAPVSREHQLIIPHGNRPQVRLPALPADAYTPDATGKRGGIEAKIDKDLGSEPPARKFDADRFVMAPDVYIGRGTLAIGIRFHQVTRIQSLGSANAAAWSESSVSLWSWQEHFPLVMVPHTGMVTC
jgi:hypothetical protein